MLRVVLAGLALLFSVGQAYAVPVNWSFNVSPTINGTFTYDASTNMLTNIMVNGGVSGFLTEQNSAPLATPSPLITDASNIYFWDTAGANLFGAQWMVLELGSPLTDAGGSVIVTDVYGGTCGAPDCDSRSGRWDGNYSAQETVDSNVPVPSSGFLIVGAIGALIARRKFR